MKNALAAAVAAALAAALLAGCGSASTKDFCDDGLAFSHATKFEDGVKAVRRWKDTGSPDGMPEKAHRGYDLVVDLVGNAKDRADLEKRYRKLSKDQQADMAALDDYLEKTCGAHSPAG